MLVGSHERFDVRGLGKEEAREVEKRRGLATRAKLVLASTPWRLCCFTCGNEAGKREVIALPAFVNLPCCGRWYVPLTPFVALTPLRLPLRGGLCGLLLLAFGLK